MKTKEYYGIQILSHVILFIGAAAAIFPILILFSSSLTEQATIIQNGYNVWPRKFGLEAYEYLWKQRDQIFRAYGVTALVTVIGTIANVTVTSLLAYPLSRRDLPGRNVFSFLVFFTMLFNGGLVPTYLMYTEYFHIKNTLFALLVPTLLMSPWYVFLMRTNLASMVPDAIIESASIDGATEFTIFRKIVLPMGRPIIATVALFSGINYWNDWYNGMIYLTKSELFSIQNLLNRMLADIQFLSTNAAMAGNMGEMAASIPGTTVRMAIAAVGILPIIIIYPFVQNNFVKGIAVGAVKG
jgi:putative aldouronate transport system permease protein